MAPENPPSYPPHQNPLIRAQARVTNAQAEALELQNAENKRKADEAALKSTNVAITESVTKDKMVLLKRFVDGTITGKTLTPEEAVKAAMALKTGGLYAYTDIETAVEMLEDFPD